MQYLTYTRQDLIFTVIRLSQFLQSPTVLQWKALKRVFWYLKGTVNAGIFIQSGNHLCFPAPFTILLPLTGFSDADWAVSKDDRKSIGGHCVYLGDSLISWSSRKQNAVAHSSTELEYRSFSNLASEVVWVKALLSEIKFSCNTRQF